jgi:hypothetical protein
MSGTSKRLKDKRSLKKDNPNKGLCVDRERGREGGEERGLKTNDYRARMEKPLDQDRVEGEKTNKGVWSRSDQGGSR